MSTRAGIALLAIGLLSGCSLFGSDRYADTDPDAQQRAADPYHTDPAYTAEAESSAVTGDRYKSVTEGDTVWNNVFGSKEDKTASNGGGGGAPGVGVNSYLWRATLDTVSFMPLASADPFGGVIITDWYSPPDEPNERFKVNIFILGRELRADGVRASVFRQDRDPSGNWVDAKVDQTTGTDLENAILTRARQMRLSTAAK